MAEGDWEKLLVQCFKWHRELLESSDAALVPMVTSEEFEAYIALVRADDGPAKGLPGRQPADGWLSIYGEVSRLTGSAVIASGNISKIEIFPNQSFEADGSELQLKLGLREKGQNTQSHPGPANRTTSAVIPPNEGAWLAQPPSGGWPHGYPTMTAPGRYLRAQTQPRRGLRREEAAAYIGFSARKFDELVADGRMPKPKRIDGVVVWDIHRLDLAFDALPEEGGDGGANAWG
jgi:predicted DNA-binding transcriptional regulator AlpA